MSDEKPIDPAVIEAFEDCLAVELQLPHDMIFRVRSNVLPPFGQCVDDDGVVHGTGRSRSVPHVHVFFCDHKEVRVPGAWGRTIDQPITCMRCLLAETNIKALQ